MTDNNKLLIGAMVIGGVLLLKYMLDSNAMLDSNSNSMMESMTASTAEWIEQPTDIVQPSVNEKALMMPQRPAMQPNSMAKEAVNSHLIFKDGNVPRDYVVDDNMNKPEEVLDSAELLPDDENNTWTDVNPQGSGSIAYKNFLDVGHHIGQINVIRNSDTGFRVQYPNPQFNVGPWAQSTILPNVHIGADSDVCL